MTRGLGHWSALWQSANVWESFGIRATLREASASKPGTRPGFGAFELAMAELFAETLINREPRWPVLLRLTGASLVVHIATLAILLYVPGVRDAFNIASMLANAGYVDKPYDRTEINEDVRMLALADKFRYPPVISLRIYQLRHQRLCRFRR